MLCDPCTPVAHPLQLPTGTPLVMSLDMTAPCHLAAHEESYPLASRAASGEHLPWTWQNTYATSPMPTSKQIPNECHDRKDMEADTPMHEGDIYLFVYHIPHRCPSLKAFGANEMCRFYSFRGEARKSSRTNYTPYWQYRSIFIIF